ncbi:MAG: InlB B-repeat-containing protein [Bacilli bacterium]|nr:InlB B-repeat-containing protein [Bacilli bacterium]
MRGIKGIVLLILALFIVNIKSVSAKNADIIIEDIKIVSNSETVEYTNPTVKDNKISSEITFNNVNDFVTFEVTLKNNEHIKYFIEKISDDNKNSNITITYDYDNKEITEDGNKKITIKFSYNKQVEQGEDLSFDDVKITLDLTKENGEKAQVIYNPDTNDNIITYVIVFTLSVTFIGLFIKNKYVKRSMLAILLLLIAPKMINATTDDVYEINISFNNAHINGTAITYSINIDEELTKQEIETPIINSYTVNYDANDGIGSIDSATYSFDEEFTLPEDVLTRDGYDFIGWNTEKDGTGKNYSAGETVKGLIQNEEITLYANWEEISNNNFVLFSLFSMPNITPEIPDELIDDEYDSDFPVVFSAKGPCVFNGPEEYITGDSCEMYKDDKFINTNVSLFSEENYQKDFEIKFDILSYNPNNQSSETIQQTFMNIKLEDESSGYPGIVVRKSANSIHIGVKDGNGKVNYKNIKYSDIQNVRIVKKDSIIYYSINDNELTKLSDMSNFNHPFDVPLYFGASSLPDGTPMRIINAKLANMTIRMGKINKDLN